MSSTTSRCPGAGRITLGLAAAFALLVGQVQSVNVRPGQSIQAAINAAKPGDTIIVGAGTYNEHLTIKTDGLNLIGAGVTLEAPSTFITNTCTGLAGPGTQAGICVTGSGVDLEPYAKEHRKFKSVNKRVKNVSISGFTVVGFTGENIALVGAADTKVQGTTLIDGQQYGLLSVGSKNTLAFGNTVKAASVLFIGMCMDDVSPAQYTSNKISNYFIALCLQTDGGEMRQNTVDSCCVGVFVDPDVKRAVVAMNRIGQPSTVCGGFAVGVDISGAVKTTVSQNTIENQRSLGTGVGIIIGDSADPVAVASGNLVKQNILRNNDIDLQNTATGKNNVFQQNVCSGKACALG